MKETKTIISCASFVLCAYVISKRIFSQKDDIRQQHLTTKRAKDEESEEQQQKEEVTRLHSFFAEGKLVHPYLTSNYFRKKQLQCRRDNDKDYGAENKEGEEIISLNFTDLAAALALCCGASLPSFSSKHKKEDHSKEEEDEERKNHQEMIYQRRIKLSEEIGAGTDGKRRKHIIFVLCDGMGDSILDQHLNAKTESKNEVPSFLHKHNQNNKSQSLKAVFPSTTPAALTTLATATYPGRHGLPGWDLRDYKGCDFPENAATEGGPVQIRILAQQVMDVRSNRPVKDLGFEDLDEDVFIEKPWSTRIMTEGRQEGGENDNHVTNEKEKEDKSTVVNQLPPPTSSQYHPHHSRRKMVYINAYNGDDFPNWYQGVEKPNKIDDPTVVDDGNGKNEKHHQNQTDFSFWQMGQTNHINHTKTNSDGTDCDFDGTKSSTNNDKINSGSSNSNNSSSNNYNTSSKINIKATQQKQQWIDAKTINETSYDTLGQPKGSRDAIQFFSHGVDEALRIIAQAEYASAAGTPEEEYTRNNDNDDDECTFIYLYTAHPDKHMHSLGVEHDEVKNVVEGLNAELERMWNVLGDVESLVSLYGPEATVSASGNRSSSSVGIINSSHDDQSCKKRVDAAMIVTADHGHVTVQPKDMVELPQDVLDCLEYANLGVHGKGRHAYLHCRPGLQSTLRTRWRANSTLANNFLLLTIEEATENGLFGPEPPNFKVRPRLGDFVSISLGFPTLVSPREAAKYRDASAPGSTAPRCQGAHGSLLSEEMHIPFVLCVPPSIVSSS